MQTAQGQRQSVATAYDEELTFSLTPRGAHQWEASHPVIIDDRTESCYGPELCPEWACAIAVAFVDTDDRLFPERVPLAWNRLASYAMACEDDAPESPRARSFGHGHHQHVPETSHQPREGSENHLRPQYFAENQNVKRTTTLSAR